YLSYTVVLISPDDFLNFFKNLHFLPRTSSRCASQKNQALMRSDSRESLKGKLGLNLRLK
ncbi:MAG: hypothetical protein QME40_01280, partial [bacterium]|nr:hypothetical protein [bacterium]